MCWALRAVHAQGLVHGDVKPANIVATRCDRRSDGVKLIDFGLVRPMSGQNDASESAAPSTFAGSPLYAPPETMAGAVDVRSDIYSLGATAFFLLAGRPVFDEDQPLAAILAHAGRAPASVKSVQPQVPAALDAIIMKCLAKNPVDRFQSVEELDAALTKASQLIVAAEHARGAAFRVARPRSAAGRRVICGILVVSPRPAKTWACHPSESRSAQWMALWACRQMARITERCAALRACETGTAFPALAWPATTRARRPPQPVRSGQAGAAARRAQSGPDGTSPVRRE